MATTVLQRIRDYVGLDAGRWPPPALERTWDEIERFMAFRRSDETALRMQEGVNWRSRYLISPVPRMISRASANLLFSEPPKVEPATESDAPREEFIITENDLDSELHRAAVIASSEGEIWGRICVRPDLLDAPILEFVSRKRVIPHFAGRFIQAVTFITEWHEGEFEVYRLFETYGPGYVANELYRGTRTSVGQPANLGSFPPTAAMPEVIYTGFDRPLAQFIPNSIDSDPGRGYSDYCGLEDRFFGINRATTIGDSNTQLAGKKRALLDAQYTGPGGSVLDDDVYVRNADTGDVGKSEPMQILEYGYDASQIVSWLDHLIDSTLAFGGASPQIVGRNLDGAAVSGTALRLKMIHSLLESAGKGRYFDKGVRNLLHYAQVIDSRPTAEIGFGRPWATPDEPPQVTRQDALPQDDLEASTELASLVAANAISIEERVVFLHPEWPQDQIDEEVARLKDEQQQPIVLPR